jgi:hypothetical protein
VTYLCDICRDNGSFCEEIQDKVEPSREKCPARLGEIEASDGSEFDAQRLKENGKQVRQQDDEEQPELIGGSSCDVGRVVSGIDFVMGVS